MQKKQGFTLIELLVVITIIAILSVIVFLTVTGLTRRARNSSLSATVREAGNGISVFRNAEGNANNVITFGISENPNFSTINGVASWGPFTGTTLATANTSGTFDPPTELQYPTAINRVPTSQHALHYRILAPDDTDYTLSATQNRQMFSLGESNISACVMVLGELVDDTGGDITMFYRNGTVSGTATVYSAITCSNP